MAVETVGEGTDSVGKYFYSFGTNERADLAVMTMTSMVQDIALQFEWLGAWLNLFLLGLKFGMVRIDARIDAMGGFPDSNMTDTNNSSIKNHAYCLINVLHGANIEIFKCVLAWTEIWHGQTRHMH